MTDQAPARISVPVETLSAGERAFSAWAATSGADGTPLMWTWSEMPQSQQERWAKIARAAAPAVEGGEVKRVMNRADLTNATTPGHADTYLNALLDYTAGFYGDARKAGMPAASVADAMNHVERAARGLHALALRALTVPASSDAVPVGVAEAFNAHMTCATFDKSQVPVGSELYVSTSSCALKPFAEAAANLNGDEEDDQSLRESDKLRIAVAALKPFAGLNIPRKSVGNAGAYSLLHIDILRATEALSALTASEGK